jgi:uncharacterized membrane protein
MGETHSGIARTDTRRAESFGEAVLAVVLALLALDLIPSELPAGGLWQGLVARWPAYAAFATSFLYVAVVWLDHEAAFRRIREMDRGLRWANLFVLFAVALLPFPTAVLARALESGNPDDVRSAIALYAGIGVLLCLSWAVFFVYLDFHHELVTEGVTRSFFAQETMRALLGAALHVLAGVIGFALAPSIAMALFFSLAVLFGVTSQGSAPAPIALRKRARRPVTAHDAWAVQRSQVATEESRESG